MLLEINDIGSRPNNGERFLNDVEIGAFWNAIDKTKMSWQNKIFIRIVALTGCRGVELRLAKKTDFDLKSRGMDYTERELKNAWRFVRGISKLAADYLQQVFDLYPDLSISYFLRLSYRKIAQCHLPAPNFYCRTGRRCWGEHWSLHDLRKTCKTKILNLEVAHSCFGKILGHKLLGMLAVMTSMTTSPSSGTQQNYGLEKLKCSEINPLSFTKLNNYT